MFWISTSFLANSTLGMTLRIKSGEGWQSQFSFPKRGNLASVLFEAMIIVLMHLSAMHLNPTRLCHEARPSWSAQARVDNLEGLSAHLSRAEGVKLLNLSAQSFISVSAPSYSSLGL